MRTIVFLVYFCFSFSFVQAREQIILTSDSVQLYVNIKGDGPPCLFIHGGPGGGSYMLEIFMGDSLERHFQMIYLDQRGTGNSSSPKDNNYSMDRMIRDFEEVREELGINQWLTMGHSFGGILQMGYVIRKPNAIQGLIFINCTLSMNESFEKSWMPKAIEFAGTGVPPVCLDTTISVLKRMMNIIPVLNERDIRWKMFFALEENNREMNASYSHYTHWNGDFSDKGLEIADYWNDFKKFTLGINQPVLFYYGKQDWAIGPEHYKGVLFPNMILWGSEVGHMPFLENKEDLMKAIDNYLVYLETGMKIN